MRSEQVLNLLKAVSSDNDLIFIPTRKIMEKLALENITKINTLLALLVCGEWVMRVRYEY